MSERAIDAEGNVYEQGWDGQYRQKQGVFGPQRETDAFGRDKIGGQVVTHDYHDAWTMVREGNAWRLDTVQTTRL